MQMPNFDFHHCAISVPDIEAAIDWYVRVLDVSVEFRGYIEKARVQMAMLKRGALRFEIFQPESGKALPEGRRDPLIDFQTHGNKHAAFRVDDLDVLLEVLRAKGADIAVIIDEDGFRGCFIRDCAGNPIEFVEEKPAA